LVLMDDETYEEKISFGLTRLNVFVLLGTLTIVLIALTTVIIAFTPLREYIPGYMDTRIPKLVYNLQRKTDSLELIITQRTNYLSSLRNVISGNIPDDSSDVGSLINNSINYDTVELKTSETDSVFRAEFIRQNQFNLNLYDDHQLTQYPTPENITFFTPLKGIITNNFNLAEKHYGIDIVSGKDETIKAAQDGTVVFSDWTLETGYVIGIQHQGNYISVYKHNSSLLKKTGSYVRAGDPIAIVGETGELSTGPHLHFELWYNGTPVNPIDYIVF